MGKALFAAALLLFAGLSFSEFAIRSLSVFIEIGADGSADVEERLYVAMNTSSKDLYEATRSAYSDIATWQERTGLSELRHHISRAKAEISNLRITPQAIDHCNAVLDLCFANIVIDYSVPAGQNGSGLVKVERYKPRTALFSLKPDALSFERTKSGDLVLPKGTNITFIIPPNAQKIYFSSPPQNIAGEGVSSIRYYKGKTRQFTWNGDLLPDFQFTYEIESPLEDEVIGFFSGMQQKLAGFFFGPEGIPAMIILLAAALSAFYLHKLGKG
jgi:hypothetical protein